MTPETSSSTAVDWEVLRDFLLSDRTPDTCMRPAEVDGFLTGIAVSPDMILPSDWLPVIWGGGEPEFTGIEEASRVLGLVLRESIKNRGAGLRHACSPIKDFYQGGIA